MSEKQDADFVEHLEGIRDRCRQRIVTADDAAWLLLQLDDYMESLGDVIDQRDNLTGMSDKDYYMEPDSQTELCGDRTLWPSLRQHLLVCDRPAGHKGKHQDSTYVQKPEWPFND